MTKIFFLCIIAFRKTDFSCTNCYRLNFKMAPVMFTKLTFNNTCTYPKRQVSLLLILPSFHLERLIPSFNPEAFIAPRSSDTVIHLLLEVSRDSLQSLFLRSTLTRIHDLISIDTKNYLN